MDLTDEQIAAARERGRVMFETQPRALAAGYDADSGRIVVDLSNGATYAFPAVLGQGLESATPEQLAEVEILGAGFGLHWESLDVDLSIPGLLAGRFGTNACMSELASKAGSVKSPAKASAARASGAKVGRPRKAG